MGTDLLFVFFYLLLSRESLEPFGAREPHKTALYINTLQSVSPSGELSIGTDLLFVFLYLQLSRESLESSGAREPHKTACG